MQISKIIGPAFNPQSRQCEDCGNQFTPLFSTAFLDKFVTRCEHCVQIQITNETEKIIRESKEFQIVRWKAICPPEFIETDPAKLPAPRKLEEALKWEYGPIGLMLHGDTRKGKSRIAWQVARREFKAGKSIKALNASSGIRYAALYTQSTANAERWFDFAASCDLLILDDVFKVKLTEAFECALFGIICERTEHRRPFIVTMNDTGDTLLSRLSQDRGASMIERLREFCKIIRF